MIYELEIKIVVIIFMLVNFCFFFFYFEGMKDNLFGSCLLKYTYKNKFNIYTYLVSLLYLYEISSAEDIHEISKHVFFSRFLYV